MDELIKRLRETAISADSGNEISESLYRDIMKAADAIEQLIEERDAYRKAMTDEHNRAAKLAWEKEHCWIPVDERLPKEAGKYLVCGRWRGKQTEIWVCEFMALGYLKGWANNAANPSISHWMPLPPAPKEESYGV